MTPFLRTDPAPRNAGAGGRNIDFPFHLDGSGRVATTGYDNHIVDMIEQILFTSPGERVNRPDFGCGIQQLLFAPESAELIAAGRMQVQAALSRWLEDRIQTVSVDVAVADSKLTITVEYIVLRHGGVRRAEFSR
jgi:phage baseplate assembly protein W